MTNFVNGYKYVTLFFDYDINRFVDGMGNVIHDIFRMITPNQLMLFRKNRDMQILLDRTHKFKVVLIALEESKDLKY